MQEIKPKKIRKLVQMAICEEEARLLIYGRKIRFGSLKEIKYKDGVPYQIIKTEQSILLTEPIEKNGNN